jgi:ubiquinone biosynthesis protein COQ9
MSDGLIALRDKILEAALPHIPFDGWTMQAMRRGARDVGLTDSDALRAFPYGGADMIVHFGDLSDRRMVAEMECRGVASMKIRERIATAVRVRLELATPHKEAARRAMTIMALPTNAPQALRSLYRTVDAIWIAAGDTATDWNYYSKRGLLAGVLSTTVLCWLDDKSDGNAVTWAFLDRRIANVMSIPRITERVQKACGRFVSPFRMRTYPKI